MQVRPLLGWVIAAVLALVAPGTAAPDAQSQASSLVRALCDRSRPVDGEAARTLVKWGDAAVPALVEAVGSTAPLHVRRLSAEVLGDIGTEKARLALTDLLPKEKSLAVRSQICFQLGMLREARAVPAMLEWLKTTGPQSLNDIPGTKDVPPSGCYCWHLDALGMIGDDRAIPALEEFRRRIPQNVGYGGFITRMVTEGADRALARIRAYAEFQDAVRRQAGLEEKIRPLMAYLRTNRVALFRLWEDDVIRRNAQGRTVLAQLAGHTDPALATAAKALLAAYDTLK